eukprot:6479141-Amphidinium_carterae.2
MAFIWIVHMLSCGWYLVAALHEDATMQTPRTLPRGSGQLLKIGRFLQSFTVRQSKQKLSRGASTSPRFLSGTNERLSLDKDAPGCLSPLKCISSQGVAEGIAYSQKRPQGKNGKETFVPRSGRTVD